MAFSVTSELIMDAARKRGWEVAAVDEEKALYSLKLPDGSIFYVRSISTYKSGVVNVTIADHKDLFASIADKLQIQMPMSRLFTDLNDARTFLGTYQKIVVKPTDQAHGNGITVNITTPEQLDAAVKHALTFSKKILLQEHVEGDDHRVLMIDQKLAAAAIRKPAYIIGDGTHTVRQLIDTENSGSERTDGYTNKLVKIDAQDAERYLAGQMDYIVPANEEFRVMGTANIGKGGVSIDVTDTIDPEIVKKATQITNHLRIGVCGVDFLVTSEGKSYLIEINTRPSLGLHEYPWKGVGQGTPDKFLDWLIKE